MVVYVISVKEDRCIVSIFKEIGYEKGDYARMEMSVIAGAQVFVGASGGNGGRVGADLSARGNCLGGGAVCDARCWSRPRSRSFVFEGSAVSPN